MLASALRPLVSIALIGLCGWTGGQTGGQTSHRCARPPHGAVVKERGGDGVVQTVRSVCRVCLSLPPSRNRWCTLTMRTGLTTYRLTTYCLTTYRMTTHL